MHSSWPCFGLECSLASLLLALAANFGFANSNAPCHPFGFAGLYRSCAFAVGGRLNHLATPLLALLIDPLPFADIEFGCCLGWDLGLH